eukprot:CAMPEP_0178436334 /NCGR_PEP_ID=MMETSP0689_2-20121128/34386_1 /TAXON_ID=160604 /ORGANISM="Amphidinium massartii, Strain CS-259" /LENGTH=365 /DNA_ID=CAMNT_0020058427 /DNA_START=89 /DNA_END=1184 /DNA_ORIENTATION=+
MDQTQREGRALREPSSRVAWGAFYAVGVIVSMVLYGFMQERIMTMPYGTGANQSNFRESIFLVFSNRVWAVLFSVLVLFARREQLQPAVPYWKYVIVALSNVISGACTTEALKDVSFPVEMLAKSFRMIPVMCWGIAVAEKEYGILDWLVAVAITGGVTMFLLTGPTAARPTAAGSEGSTAIGLLLLVAALAADGFCAVMQEVLFKEYKTSRYNQMLHINTVSAVVSCATLLGSGGFARAFTFIGTYPLVVLDIVLNSSAQVVGQWFLYGQIEFFGALAFAATSNVRQVVSILVSYLHFHHYITALQVLGLVVVFAAILCKNIAGFWAPPADDKRETEPLMKPPEVVVEERQDCLRGRPSAYLEE